MDTIDTPTDTSPDTASDTANNPSQILIDLESMIKSSITGIDLKKNELRKLNEMTESFLSQDSTYAEHEKASKEAARIKNATKSQLLKQPAVAQSIAKAKELKAELKETQDGLSDYLREFQRMSGANEIEDDNGEVRDIVYTAKLVKRTSKGK